VWGILAEKLPIPFGRVAKYERRPGFVRDIGGGKATISDEI